jgi:hypothetical protein
MGKRKNDPIPVTWDRLTEPLRRGRKRIKPEFIPELVAWLLVQSYQYERIVQHFRSLATRPDDEILKYNGEYAKHALSVLQSLINSLADGFDRFNWEEAKEEVYKHLNMDDSTGKETCEVDDNKPFDLKSGC